MLASNEGSKQDADIATNKMVDALEVITRRDKTFVPDVEGVQDAVEKELILGDYVKTAKAYILYRQKRSEIRQQSVRVPEHVKKTSRRKQKIFSQYP